MLFSEGYTMQLIDSHCHLDFDVLYEQLDDVLARASAAGVNEFLVPAVKVDNWQKVLDLASRYPTIYPALGFHPYFLADYQPEQIQILKKMLVAHPEVIAIGECGLDKMIDIPFTLQLDVLEQQLYLAKEMGLPVILHCRKAHNELIVLLKKVSLPRGGVIHAFSGSESLAKTYVKLGFKIGVGGVITYPRANKTRNAIANLPLNCILLETDAPDMPIYQQNGQINEPVNIEVVLKVLAMIKNKTKVDVSSEIYCGFYELFFLK